MSLQFGSLTIHAQRQALGDSIDRENLNSVRSLFHSQINRDACLSHTNSGQNCLIDIHSETELSHTCTIRPMHVKIEHLIFNSTLLQLAPMNTRIFFILRRKKKQLFDRNHHLNFCNKSEFEKVDQCAIFTVPYSMPVVLFDSSF